MLIRVGESGRPAFQLRPGEQGISIFDPLAVTPELSEFEILAAFRPGSVIVKIDRAQIDEAGLIVVRVAGAGNLSQRLQEAHAEIRPGVGMTRGEFKARLRKLDDHVR